MIEKRYIAASGAQFNDDAAELVGATLEKIEARDGNVTPRRLVDEARPHDSPIHGLFEWDDDKAGEAWRVHQARQIINHLRVVIVRDEQQSTPRAFFNVAIKRFNDDDIRQSYVSLESAQRNPEYTAAIRKRAASELRSWKERYLEIRYLFPDTFDAIGREAVIERAESVTIDAGISV